MYKLGVIIAGALWLAASSLTAQEGLQSAVRGDHSYETRHAPNYIGPENGMRMGPVQLELSATYGLEWNDNINLSSTNRESDFIHTPGMHFRAQWPATETSTLIIGAGIGYRKYMDHPEFDGLDITPDSEVSWDITAGDFIFTVHDRASYSQEVISQPGLSGVGQLPRIENSGGLRMQWMPEYISAEVGWDHYNFFSSSSTNNFLSRSSEQFFGRLAYRLAPVSRVGIEASGSLTDYEAPSQGDNQSLSIGPFIDWQLTTNLRITLRGGYVIYYQGGAPGTTNTSNLSSYYAGVTVRHKLTEFLDHGISFDHSAQQSINQGGGVGESSHIGYDVSWAVLAKVGVSTSLYYEEGSEPQFLISEKYDRFGARLSINIRATDRLNLNLGYNYTTKGSNIRDRDYLQNSVSLLASYRF